MFGQNIEADIAVDPPYPGKVLAVNSTGSEVARMQTYLNAIGTSYHPQLAKLTVDGVFGQNTKNIVIEFQAINGLNIDGVIARKTWNAIVTEYNSFADGNAATFPGIAMRAGIQSADTRLMQETLNAIGRFYLAIPPQTADGNFTDQTTHAVRLFQMQFGLSPDGVLGNNTWQRIFYVQKNIPGSPVPVTPPSPDIAIAFGAENDFVRLLQAYLNHIRTVRHYNWPALKVDGIFGYQTQNAVQAFQALNQLSADGTVDTATWESLLSTFNTTLAGG